MALTLESIRRHYRAASSPLADVLARYRHFFAAFENFGGYVDFWLLQDMVTHDHSAVRFFTAVDDFKPAAIPRDVGTDREYRRHSIEFVEARSRRIDRL